MARKYSPAEQMSAFDAKYIKGAPEECWPWSGCLDAKGYGRCRFGGRPERAYRVAFYKAHGAMPVQDGCHSCNYPACVNPAHIYDGTRKQNMADRKRARREANTKGERNGRSVLKVSDVLAIREGYVKYSRGENNQNGLAEKYGVDYVTVGKIIRGELWKSVKAEG